MSLLCVVRNSPFASVGRGGEHHVRKRVLGGGGGGGLPRIARSRRRWQRAGCGKIVVEECDGDWNCDMSEVWKSGIEETQVRSGGWMDPPRGGGADGRRVREQDVWLGWTIRPFAI